MVFSIPGNATYRSDREISLEQSWGGTGYAMQRKSLPNAGPDNSKSLYVDRSTLGVFDPIGELSASADN